MSTLAQIRKQIEELQQKATEIQVREKEGVLAEIRQKIVDYGITPQDLGLVPAKAPRKPRSPSAKPRKAAKAKSEPKFRGPDGQTWSGGRGRKPGWVMEIISSGGDIEKYRVRGKKAG
jgi:DNA-binding protein H-NS